MIKFFVIVLLSFFCLSCAKQEARKPVSVKSVTSFGTPAETNKKLLKAQQDFFKKMFKCDSLNTYIASENGFWYKYLTQDTTATLSPKTNDLIKITYEIKNIDNTLIYSQKEIGLINYKFDKQQTLPFGLRAAVKLMHLGETISVYLPSSLAYGHLGDKHKIKTNTPIICTITLLEIQKSNL